MFYRPYSFVVTVARIYCIYNEKSLLCFFFRTRGSCGICQGIIFFLEREREKNVFLLTFSGVSLKKCLQASVYFECYLVRRK